MTETCDIAIFLKLTCDVGDPLSRAPLPAVVVEHTVVAGPLKGRLRSCVDYIREAELLLW